MIVGGLTTAEHNTTGIRVLPLQIGTRGRRTLKLEFFLRQSTVPSNMALCYELWLVEKAKGNGS